jgi:hypothetical protein
MGSGHRLVRHELLRQRDPFGEGTDGIAWGARIDRIARLEARGPRAGRQHDATGIEPERARQAIPGDTLQIATNDLEVDRIETGGMNFDQDLVRTCDGIGDIGEPDMIRDCAIGIENKGAHEHHPVRWKFLQCGANRAFRTRAYFLPRLCAACPRP